MTVTPSPSTVPDLAFAVTGAEGERFAALPTLRFRLEITRSGGSPVTSVALTTAIRIDAARRRYGPECHRALAELFGAPERWGSTMRPLAWTRTTLQVPAFDDRTTVEIPVACSYDTELAVTRYLRAVRDGDVPLDFQFSGTVFHQAPGGGLRAAHISWAGDASYALPAALWQGLTDRYHAGGSWLRLSRATRERLDEYRVRHVLGSSEDAVRSLLDRALHHTGTP